jgi:hypothetical protein
MDELAALPEAARDQERPPAITGVAAGRNAREIGSPPSP